MNELSACERKSIRRHNGGSNPQQSETDTTRLAGGWCGFRLLSGWMEAGDCAVSSTSPVNSWIERQAAQVYRTATSRGAESTIDQAPNALRARRARSQPLVALADDTWTVGP